MRACLTALATVVGMLALQFDGSAQRTAILQIQAVAIDDVRTWDTYIRQRERTGDLRISRVDIDPLMPLETIERLQQFHRNVPVWGADVVRVSEGGVTQSIFGALSPDLDLSIEPALAPAMAETSLLQLLGDDARLLTRTELVVLRLDAGEHRLAYMAVVAGRGQVVRTFIDARDGSELLRLSEIHTQAAVGTGLGVLGDLKKLSVVREASSYFADDQLRPPLLRTFDLRGNFTRAFNVINFSATLFSSDRATDLDNQWDDHVAVDAHAYIGWTYDYYLKRFGRRGLDNRDRPLTALINGLSQQNGALFFSDFSDYVINAFWCGVCGPAPTGLMYFGNGISQQFTLNGQNVGYLAASLDIIAHELTHGVTESSSGLLDRPEPGALNEAFSDIMGTSVEFYYQSPGNGLRQADYLIGEDTFRGVTVARNGIRSLENPQAYPQLPGFTTPDHYSRRYTGPQDSGGVHINAGIPGNAFYLAIEGGINRTSGLAVQGVGAGNREQIEKTFYRGFTFLLPRDASFSIARAATIQAARDLYGAGGGVERAVTQAWTAVGVN